MSGHASGDAAAARSGPDKDTQEILANLQRQLLEALEVKAKTEENLKSLQRVVHATPAAQKKAQKMLGT